MFNSPRSSSYDQGKATGAAATVIARGVKVEGEFTSQSDVLIEGEVHGTLSTAGTLTVGTDAKIKADVKAGGAMVSGEVEGNVTVEKLLDIKATAKITGDITAETITVESGATLVGRVSIGVKAATAEAGVSTRSRSGMESAASRRERTAAPVLASES